MTSSDYSVSFCRTLLTGTYRDLRDKLPKLKPQKQMYVIKSGMGDIWEGHFKAFECYPTFYWHGRANNAFDARQKAWAAWLDYNALEGILKC